MHPHTQQAGRAGLACHRGLGLWVTVWGGLIFPPVSLLSEHWGLLSVPQGPSPGESGVGARD